VGAVWRGFVVVDFCGGVLASWSGAVPPGDLAAVRPHRPAGAQPAAPPFGSYYVYASPQCVAMCNVDHGLARTATIGVFPTKAQSHFTFVRKTPIVVSRAGRKWCPRKRRMCIFTCIEPFACTLRLGEWSYA